MFDLFNIFFLVLAAVIFLALRNVLGRRTGNERPPFERYSRTERSGDDKVVSLPGARPPAASPPPPEVVESEIDWDKYAKPGTPVRVGLANIARADRGFDPGQFLAGAKIAYEEIVTAFAAGDRKTLRSLLSKTVFDSFEAAITEREQNGERVDSKFVGINAADLVDASLNGNTAQVTVQFRSQLISATFDSDGELIDGDAKAVRDVTEFWTFERDVASRDPNWRPDRDRIRALTAASRRIRGRKRAVFKRTSRETIVRETIVCETMACETMARETAIPALAAGDRRDGPCPDGSGGGALRAGGSKHEPRPNRV